MTYGIYARRKRVYKTNQQILEIMAEFSFNGNGVCVNPHVIQRTFTEPYWFDYKIKTAQTRYGWIAGCSVGFRNGSGFGVPCSWKCSQILFPNEHEAVRFACQRIKRYMSAHRTGRSSSVPDTDIPLWEKFMLDRLDDDVQPALF